MYDLICTCLFVFCLGHSILSQIAVPVSDEPNHISGVNQQHSGSPILINLGNLNRKFSFVSHLKANNGFQTLPQLEKINFFQPATNGHHGRQQQHHRRHTTANGGNHHHHQQQINVDANSNNHYSSHGGGNNSSHRQQHKNKKQKRHRHRNVTHWPRMMQSPSQSGKHCIIHRFFC